MAAFRGSGQLSQLHQYNWQTKPFAGGPNGGADAAGQIWGWLSPTTGLAAPSCSFLGCGSQVNSGLGSGSATPGAITLFAYWGVIGTARDPLSPTCRLLCGADGNAVFNRAYPLHRNTATVSAITPAQKPSTQDIY